MMREVTSMRAWGYCWENRMMSSMMVGLGGAIEHLIEPVEHDQGGVVEQMLMELVLVKLPVGPITPMEKVQKALGLD
jgi:hypothetical protein